MMGFAAQSSGLQIICSVLEFHTQLFLHEYDQASVPAQPSDALMLIRLYEAIASWVKLMGNTAKSIEASQAKKRTSRASHIMAMHSLQAPKSSEPVVPAATDVDAEDDDQSHDSTVLEAASS
ncbi:hypothetical protein HDU90_008390 [Geranomyces variabilis]|nr:hypothetical protein HDU90_008390 [Geranomyces variabilis]